MLRYLVPGTCTADVMQDKKRSAIVENGLKFITQNFVNFEKEK